MRKYIIQNRLVLNHACGVRSFRRANLESGRKVPLGTEVLARKDLSG